MDDSIDDDIAYVGDEDDERGPGCLVALATLFSILAILSFGCSLIWLIAMGAFEAGAIAAGNINNAFFYTINFVVMGFSLLAGGFGLGLGLYAASQSRLSNRPDLSKWAFTVAIIGAVAVLGVIGTAFSLVVIQNFSR